MPSKDEAGILSNGPDTGDRVDRAEEGGRSAAPGTDDIAWLLVGGGAFGLLVSLLARRRGLRDLAPFAVLIGSGAAVLWRKRQTRMEATQERVQRELDALDPVARAQVLKAVTADQLTRIPGLES